MSAGAPAGRIGVFLGRENQTAACSPSAHLPLSRVGCVTDTSQRLLDAAVEALRIRGIAGTSGRVIAALAGVNQALIFYHFGSVDGLLDAACRAATEQQIGRYRARLAEVSSLRELLEVGCELHARERQAGNVTMLAQLLAGAQQDAKLAATCKEALSLWTTEIGAVLGRLLADSPVAEIADIPGLARAVAAAFIGIELYDGVDPDGAAAALSALQQLVVLAEAADDLGPVVSRALRARLRRAGQPRNREGARIAADRPDRARPGR